MQPIPPGGTGRDTEGQSTEREGGDEDDGDGKGESGSSARAGAGAGGRSGTSTGTNAGGGGGGGGADEEDGASGDGAGPSMSGGGRGGSMSGDSGSGGGMSGAGAAQPSGPTPMGPVIAACMGRPDETVCDGSALIKCGSAGEAADRKTCMTAEQCRAGLEAGGGECGMCDPGAIGCEGAELRECTMTGDYMVKETCASEALCNEMMAVCDPPACEADEYKCESGSLLKCNPERTDFDVEDSCAMELCDAANKKCNVCVPSSRECQGNTLKVCSADGSGSTDMACSGATDRCVEDRCVECTADSECMPDSECQTGSCNVETGRCASPTAKTVGTGCSEGVCNLTGQCVACNTDLDCAADQRCSILGCVQRVPLSAGLSLLPGVVSITLNAGYGLRVSGTTMQAGDSVSFSGFGAGSGTITASTPQNASLVTPSPSGARTITFRGPDGTTCQASGFGDSQVTLRFARPVDTSTGGAAACSDVTVTVEAHLQGA